MKNGKLDAEKIREEHILRLQQRVNKLKGFKQNYHKWLFDSQVVCFKFWLILDDFCIVLLDANKNLDPKSDAIKSVKKKGYLRTLL